MRVRLNGSVVEIKLPAWLSRGRLIAAAMFIILFTGLIFLTRLDPDDYAEHPDARAIKSKVNLRSQQGQDYSYGMEEIGGKKSRRKGDINQNDMLAPPGKRGHDLAMPGHPGVNLAVADLELDGQNKVRMAMAPAEDRRQTLSAVVKDILNRQNRPTDTKYNLNATLSDTISLDRDIPDTRPKVCQTFTYDHNRLAMASVVIPFYNEALSMLLRTVHSILNRSPDDLLREVILVDDASTHEWLKEPLDRYLALLPKVKLIRQQQREGLIRSRMTGYRLALGPVVVFQDAHTEANEGWLEPLLDELDRHPRSVIQPFVDGIDANSLQYNNPPTMYKGSFSWELRYTWLRVSDHAMELIQESGQPYFSPTLVGCAMALYKPYFDEIGGFDEGLKVWGGENIELGFRVWMCGGRVMTVTCSRVGHVFKDFPYKFDGNKEEIVQKNLMRVAEVWMDSARANFYASSRTYEFKRTEFTDEELTSLKERIDLRKKLQCQNFEWYLYNVIPEMSRPRLDAVYYGEISNIKSKACFELLDDYEVGMTYYCYEHKIIPRNNFALTKDGVLMWREKCVITQLPSPVLKLGECDPVDLETRTVWSVENRGHTWGVLKATKRSLDGKVLTYCVTQVTNALPNHKGEQMAQLSHCEEDNSFQLWGFSYKMSWNMVPDHVIQMRDIV